MESRSGIITLTTDFGSRDAYVGAMKGVMASILPSVRLIDITHEIRPQKIQEAAYLIEAACPWFPPGTVHLAVVDPGVGTARRPIAVYSDGQIYVGPDNGVLTAALGGKRVFVHQISDIDYEMPERSTTFHGRDVFAPAAAHVASGVSLENLGPAVRDAVRLEMPQPRVGDGVVVGEIVRIDRFGNAISNVARRALRKLGRGPYLVTAKGQALGRLRGTFQDVDAGSPVALVGGEGRVEVGVNGGSAAEELGLEPGDPIEVRRSD